ncbi:unnamed protein product [Cuscuta epithymum]|uniref:Uncharacterized protein n=1 Tax=Cuscuta epithymum TaxID=186058 RepID=A0AAV0D528_9ASTE|nr:unnamed protein product [Cuscuta epithymum]
MEHYLPDIKIMVDALATINSHVCELELLQYTLLDLGLEYMSIVSTIALCPQNFPLHILHPRLLEQEQRVLFSRQLDTTNLHHACATATVSLSASWATLVCITRHINLGSASFRGHGSL